MGLGGVDLTFWKVMVLTAGREYHFILQKSMHFMHVKPMGLRGMVATTFHLPSCTWTHRGHLHTGQVRVSQVTRSEAILVAVEQLNRDEISFWDI